MAVLDLRQAGESSRRISPSLMLWRPSTNHSDHVIKKRDQEPRWGASSAWMVLLQMITL